MLKGKLLHFRVYLFGNLLFLCVILFGGLKHFLFGKSGKKIAFGANSSGGSLVGMSG